MNNYDDLFTANGEKKESKTERPFNKEEWAAKKQQERAEAFEMLDAATEEAVANPETFRDYLLIQSRFGKYSVSNALLISYQNNEATYLADFETWKEKGVFVQKGERGITLLEPGNEFTREDGSTGFSINVKKVFDISQTNSERNYSRRTPDERRVLKALISSSPCDIRMTNELDGNVCARYVPKDDAIYIRQGLDGEDIFRSLSQEIVIANFAKNGVAREDCVFTAYCATYVLCERNGFDTGDFDFEKVPEMFKDADPKEIRGQLDKIRDSANELSQDMNRIMEEQQKSKRSRDDGAR
ncbi:putative uncharacterized protein [Candidatus Colimorpha enterica]|uniref:N-terminal domain-containing protein n=1 Tax=Candidatus Colimorpha enterica TaxID=3083063 RepID=R6UB93_9BACT|nr:putative uncharacterized protein [Candidatus Colimorpha enterica]